MRGASSRLSSWAMLLSLLGVACAVPAVSSPPRHVHLAYTASAGVVVTWNTRNATATSTVHFWNPILNRTVVGSQTPFRTASSPGRRTGPYYDAFIHRATLPDLTPGETYTYSAGDTSGGWSEPTKFFYSAAAAAAVPRSPISFLALADMSSSTGDGGHGGVARQLAREVERRHYDVVLHAGDIAYNLHQLMPNGSSVGDAFMHDIDPIASKIPYMVSPGNHESYFNFTHYKNRFTMPQARAPPSQMSPSSPSSENMWWSLDLGLVHIVSYNTEAYFDDNPSNATMRHQFAWLVADLAAASEPAQRAKVPWIIAMGHRPFYCNVQNNETGGCDGEQEQSRVGPPQQRGAFSIEALFHRYGVDLALFGHVHDYTRFRPTFNRTVDWASVSVDGSVYTNPKATSYFTIGGAGNPEMPQPPQSKCSSWDAKGNASACTPITSSPWAVCESGYFPRCPNFNFGRCVVHNSTHLSWEQVSVTKPGLADASGTVLQNASVLNSGQVIDSLLLVQHNHGPFRN